MLWALLIVRPLPSAYAFLVWRLRGVSWRGALGRALIAFLGSVPAVLALVVWSYGSPMPFMGREPTPIHAVFGGLVWLVPPLLLAWRWR